MTAQSFRRLQKEQGLPREAVRVPVSGGRLPPRVRETLRVQAPSFQAGTSTVDVSAGDPRGLGCLVEEGGAQTAGLWVLVVTALSLCP